MIQEKFPDPELLALRIGRGERSAVAAGLNLLDNALAPAREHSASLLAALSGERWLSGGHIVGVTGPPGVGKSSLLGAMISEWRSKGKTVAVLAVDPSSRPELGGGALLGDRLRIKSSPHDDGLFIRSLACRNQLGGVSNEVWPMTWLLLTCFDMVVIETVGVGQTEIDIAEISDTVCYVAQPASGDTIQYLKSGIMEIPDIFAVNKADLGQVATKTAADLDRIGARPDRQPGWPYPVCLVSATHKKGIPELTEHIEKHRLFLIANAQLEPLRLRHQRGWVLRLLKDEFGSFGMDLAGGREALNSRLSQNRLSQFSEYTSARQHIISQFKNSH
jgi:LAO/AO transport system kinase